MIDGIVSMVSHGGAVAVITLVLMISVALSSLYGAVVARRAVDVPLTPQRALQLSTTPLLCLGLALVFVAQTQASIAGGAASAGATPMSQVTSFLYATSTGAAILLYLAPLLVATLLLPYARCSEKPAVRLRWFGVAFALCWLGLVAGSGIALRFVRSVVSLVFALAFADPEHKLALANRGMSEARTLLEVGVGPALVFLVPGLVAMTIIAVVSARRGAVVSNGLLARLLISLGLSIVAIFLSQHG